MSATFSYHLVRQDYGIQVDMEEAGERKELQIMLG